MRRRYRVRRRQTSDTYAPTQGLSGGFKGLDDVPFFDDMVQAIHRLILLQALRTALFSSTECASQLLRESLVLTKFPKNGFMRQVRNVLRIVEICGCRGSLVRLLPTTGLPRIDT